MTVSTAELRVAEDEKRRQSLRSNHETEYRKRRYSHLQCEIGPVYHKEQKGSSDSEESEERKKRERLTLSISFCRLRDENALRRATDNDVSEHLDRTVERVWLRREKAEQKLRRRSSELLNRFAKEPTELSGTDVSRDVDDSRASVLDGQT